MLFYNTVTDTKPEAGVSPVSSGGEKGVEEPSSY
jgi:hypothetical protein